MEKASHKEILSLSIPNIISNVSIPLLSTVDTILMGQLSALHLGAIGLGGMIFNFVYWNFGFLRMGTTGITAQAYGANDNHNVGTTLIRGLLLAFCLSIGIIILQQYLFDASVLFFHIEDSHYPLIYEYYSTRMYAAPATLMMYVMMGWFFGLQNSIYPMIITICINIINIILSYTLVHQYGLEMYGVAMGTVIAQYCGLLMCLIFILYKYQSYIHSHIIISAGKFSALLSFFKVNRDLFIRTVCLTFVFAYFYRESTSAGALALAANVILLQFVNWMSYGIDGFAFAAESMVGKYSGAQDQPNLKKSIILSFFWGFILSLIFSLSYLVFYNELLHIFSENTDVINYAIKYKWWMVSFPLIAFACYIWDGVFIGLLASKQMRNSMIISLVIFWGIYHNIHFEDPLASLWLALMSFLIARAVLLTWEYKRLKHPNKIIA